MKEDGVRGGRVGGLEGEGVCREIPMLVIYALHVLSQNSQ